MQDLMLNPVTLALLLALAACAALSSRRLLRRGLCDCGDQCEGGCGGECAGCPHGCGDRRACPVEVAAQPAAQQAPR